MKRWYKRRLAPPVVEEADQGDEPEGSEWVREKLGFAADAVQARILDLRGKRVLINCTRQWGKSTVAAARAVMEAETKSESLVVVVTPSARQSAEFVRKAKKFVRKLGHRAKGDGDNEISVVFPNGSRIVGLPGTDGTVRGFSAVSLLIVDEAAQVADSTYHAVRPMQATSDGALWMMSTPHGRRGFFWEAWSKGGPEWERVAVPATECARLSPKFLEEARRECGDRGYLREYCCEFVEAEDSLFDMDLVDAAFTDLPPIGTDEKRMGTDADGAVRRQWFVGLDLGQSRDFTAMVVVERAECAGPFDAAQWAYPKEARLQVVHAERVPLGTPYPAVVERVEELTKGMSDCCVAVDGTGVGRPVVDLMRGAGRPMLPVEITGGSAEGMVKGFSTVPKKDLMMGLLVLLEQRELQIAKGMEWSGVLREELVGMKVKARKDGGERMEGDRDDLTVALALACWAGRKRYGKGLVGRSGWWLGEGLWELLRRWKRA